MNPQTAGTGNLSLLTSEFLSNLHCKQRSLICTEKTPGYYTIANYSNSVLMLAPDLPTLAALSRKQSIHAADVLCSFQNKQAVAEVQRLSIPPLDVACLFHAHVIIYNKLQAMFLLSTSRIFLQAPGTRCLFHHFEQTLKVKIIVQAQGPSATANR